MALLDLLKEGLIPLYTEKVYKNGEEGLNVIFSSVSVAVLNGIYNIIVKDGVMPIEGLTIENKKKYFNIAKKYYNTIPEQVRATKAAYALALITSIHNDDEK